MGDSVEDFNSIKDSILSGARGASERALLEQIEIVLQDEGVIVYCPSLFSQKYISRQYQDLITHSICDSLQRKVDVEFWVNARKVVRDEVRNMPVVPEKKPVQMYLPPHATAAPNRLNPKFTFDEFVVGKCNAFAYEAAKAVSDEVYSQYNPLYFYSDIGLGKSHISHAIGNQALRLSKDLRVLYTTASDFSQDYVYAVRNNCMDRFKSNYTSAKMDIFFIDDVHLFKNKEKTQMELCCVLDDLISSGKQVILSGFRPPTSMPQIDNGLKSRFSSGLVINIKRPDRKTRADIVRHKARKGGIELHDDVVEFISTNIRSSVRELESAVLTIMAMSSLMKREITLDLAKELLEGSLEKQTRINIDYIQDFVATNFGITRETMISSSRKREVVYPRQVAIFLCRRYTRESLQVIGQAFGRRHSSVIHSLEVIDEQYQNNTKVKREIDFLIEKIDSQVA